MFLQGRFYNSDINIDDCTVSRNHCRIYNLKDKLVIEDLGSKYGTLVLLQDWLSLGGGKREFENFSILNRKIIIKLDKRSVV